jgi:hypothetical protein
MFNKKTFIIILGIVVTMMLIVGCSEIAPNITLELEKKKPDSLPQQALDNQQATAHIPDQAQAELPFGSPYSFIVGDTGPAGGIIFYVDLPEYNLYDWTYLEAAPDDCLDGNGISWSNITDVEVETSVLLGTGQENTNAIISQSGHTNSAAQICDDYTYGGYDDWFLPSGEELGMMCYYAKEGLIDLGNFSNNYYYWSSSEQDASPTNKVWTYYYAHTPYAQPKTYSNNTRVRAIRAF